MKAYVVGGAVRDGLLGMAVHDRDWVVVGATPQEMLAAGYRAVGRDFPVFLHPVSNEQYALARTERKSGRGYHGFEFHAAPDVTLAQDLARRDLTINAMALDPDSGVLIDPHGGQADLHSRILRHVSDAFAEDPVRLLRVARFSARWPDFSVAPDTLDLLRKLVDAGEVDALVPERVWQELSRGLLERRPSRMFDLLRACGALHRLAPEFDAHWGAAPAGGDSRGTRLMQVIDCCAERAAPLTVRFAGLCHDLDADVGADRSHALVNTQALSSRWRVDAACRELALLAGRERQAVHNSAQLDAPGCLRLLERCDAFRRPDRFDDLLLACECIASSAAAGNAPAFEPWQRLQTALNAARGVEAGSLMAGPPSATGPTGPALGRALRQARARSIAEALARTSTPQAAPGPGIG
jgi:tRNA nucleotidyltransferase (CCA-adding enzyme)